MSPNDVARLQSVLYITVIAIFFSRGGFFVGGIIFLLGILWIILAHMGEN